MDQIILSFAFSIGFNILMFIPAFIFKTDKLTDISYALTFFVTTLYLYINSAKNLPQLLLALMVGAWSARLGGFLYIRINKIKKDRRFDGMREKFFKFLGFWLLQGLTVPVVLLGVTLFMDSDSSDFTITHYLGLATFLIGLVVEAVADAQKFRFNSDAKNKDKWISTGLWGVSRHPNYLGEIMVWLGVFVYLFSNLSTVYALVAAISPLYISGLLIFVSGIPLLEKSADQKWGKDKEYLEYKKKTPVLVPFIKL